MSITTPYTGTALGPNVPTNQHYRLKCKVVVGRKGHRTRITGELVDEPYILLLPDKDAMETWKFWAAWLPDEVDKKFEIVAIVGSPIYSPCRMAVYRKDKRCPEQHYLFVMHLVVEDEILAERRRLNLSEKDSQTIEIDVLPEDQDEQADASRY